MTEKISPVNIKSRIFQGSIFDFVQHISYRGRIFPKEAAEAVASIAPEISIVEHLPDFANQVGVLLYNRQVVIPAIESFKIAFLQEQLDNPDGGKHITYAKNYINAVTVHSYGINFLEYQVTIFSNIQWFLNEMPYYQQADILITRSADTESLLQVKNTYKNILNILSRFRLKFTEP